MLEPRLATPPFSVHAERALLANLLFKPRCYSDFDIAEKITTEYFYLSQHQKIFNAIASCLSSNSGIDSFLLINSVIDILKADGSYDEMVASGSFDPRAMAETCVSAIDIESYIEIIAQKKEIRDNINLATKMIDMSSDLTLNPTELREFRDNAIASIKQSSKKIVGIQISTILEQVVENKKVIFPVKTGIESLDSTLGGGFKPGELIIIGGRASMGKTAVACWFTLNAALGIEPDLSGDDVTTGGIVFYSAEMSAFEIACRMVATFSGMPHQVIEDGQFHGDSVNTVVMAQGQMSHLNLTIFEDIKEISDLDWFEKSLEIYKPRLVIVDYLQLIVPSSTNTVDAIASYTKRFKILAKKYEVPIILLAQLNRAVESRNDKRPMMSDLKSSGSIEQDADKIILLYREGYYNKKNDPEDDNAIASTFKSPVDQVIEIIVAKNRNGSTGTVAAKIRMDNGRIGESVYLPPGSFLDGTKIVLNEKVDNQAN